MTSLYQIIEDIEKAQERTEPLPEFRVGDTIVVSTTIIEGKKKRAQKYEGTVVRTQGSASRLSFTVRRVIDGIGVEKTFLSNSPLVATVQVTRQGKVRRARLNYLRERIGVKATRVKAKDIVSNS
jgi:large subunit ribosomal protein L19